jgi:hypothetical protein
MANVDLVLDCAHPERQGDDSPGPHTFGPP